MQVTVAAGRSWKAILRWATPEPGRSAGTRTAAISSPGSSAVWYALITKSSMGTTRVPAADQTSIRAPAASRNVAGSECGSANARFPPSVPAPRTRTFATPAAMAANAGQRSRTRGERSISRWVTPPPMTRSSPSASRRARSATPFTSIRWPGSAKPSFITSSSSVPPA